MISIKTKINNDQWNKYLYRNNKKQELWKRKVHNGNHNKRWKEIVEIWISIKKCLLCSQVNLLTLSGLCLKLRLDKLYVILWNRYSRNSKESRKNSNCSIRISKLLEENLRNWNSHFIKSNANPTPSTTSEMNKTNSNKN